MSKQNIPEKQQQQDSSNFDRKNSVLSQGSKHFSKPDFEHEANEEGEKDITPISTKDHNFMEGLDAEVQCE